MPKMKVQNLRLNTRIETRQEGEDSVQEAIFSTGYKGLRYSWDGPYYEELSMDPKHVDLGRFKNAPLLKDHSGYSIDNVVGRVANPSIKDGIGRCEIRFDEGEEGQEIKRKVDSGILGDVSIGYRVYEYTDVSKKGDKIPTLRATKWTPMELSLVCIPFDPGARVSRGEENYYECELIKREEEGETMPPEVKEPTQEAPPVEQFQRSDAVEIIKAVRDAGFESSMAEDFIQEQTPVAQVKRLLDKLSNSLQQDRQQATTNRPHTEITTDERDTIRESVQSALLYRIDQKNPLEKRADEYANMSLYEMAKDFVPRTFWKESKSSLASRALSETDFGVILVNIANVRLREAYNFEGLKTYEPFCRRHMVPDYKEETDIQFHGHGTNLEQVNAGAEYKYGEVEDGTGERYRVYKYGRIFNITEELIVNDRLNALDRFFSDLGNLAALTEEKRVYAELLNNAKMNDGLPLFDPKRNNLNIAADVSINDANISKMMQAMNMHEVGERILPITPKFLIFGPQLDPEVRRYLYARYSPVKEEDVKLYQDTFTPIKSPMIRDKRWFGIADPRLIPTIYYIYMEGMAGGPQITYKQGFEVDGIQTKVKHVFGAKAIEPMSMYQHQPKSTGNNGR